MNNSHRPVLRDQIPALKHPENRVMIQDIVHKPICGQIFPAP